MALPTLAFQLASLGTSLVGSSLDFLDSLSQSQVLRQNAGQVRRSADMMEFSAREQGRQISIAGTKAIGRAKAGYGASGLAQTGSVLDHVREQELQYEYEAAKTVYNGTVSATNARYQADMMQYQARMNAISAATKLPLSVLSGGFNVITAGARARSSALSDIF